MKKILLIFMLMATVISVLPGCKKKGDTNKPFIVLLGSNPLTWQIDVPYVDPGAEAYDITEAGDTVDISSRLQVNNNVNVEIAGDYTVDFNVSDEAGNQADTQTRKVVVILTK